VTAATLLELPVHPRSAEPERGGPTLDELIAGVWEGLVADRAAPCPVCGGTLDARYGAGAAPVAGRCQDCGSELT
jgi:hypothetical protein